MHLLFQRRASAASGGGGPLSAGPNQASTAVNSGPGSLWTSLANITAEDGATVNCNAAGPTRYLRCTGYGFAIPGGATIVGVLAEVKVQTISGSGEEFSVKLSTAAGATVSGERATPGAIVPVGLAYRSYGGDADLWDMALTPADVNDALFGVSVKFSDSGAIQVDNAQITVYYTP